MQVFTYNILQNLISILAPDFQIKDNFTWFKVKFKKLKDAISICRNQKNSFLIIIYCLTVKDGMTVDWQYFSRN